MISAEELLASLTKEDIVEILSEFDDSPKPDGNNNLYFRTVCHGGRRKKLHYYDDSKLFCCYTSCGTMSLYDLLMSINDWDFYQALRFVADYKGINLHRRRKGLKIRRGRNEDLDFLDIHTYKPKSAQEIKLPSYNDRVLKMFSDYMPLEWEQEEIGERAIKRFGVKFCFNRFAAIIPHRSSDGDLIGIRGRNFYQSDVDGGRKYMPITIQGVTYRHPTNYSLYGLHENKESIRRSRQAIIFEGEKSVLKLDSYLGAENNISVASLGMNISLHQRDLILKQGVNEITICFDKQYKVEALDGDKDSDDYKEFVRYIKNLIKIARLFINYCNVYVVFDWGDKLDYKDSPVDKGRDTFFELYKKRHLITDVQELEELISD